MGEYGRAGDDVPGGAPCKMLLGACGDVRGLGVPPPDLGEGNITRGDAPEAE